MIDLFFASLTSFLIGIFAGARQFSSTPVPMVLSYILRQAIIGLSFAFLIAWLRH